jgi:plastocyanin
MKKSSLFLVIATLGTALQLASAGDITGTVTLKGTPPPEKKIDMSADAKCGMHATEPTTHHYVVGSKGELANAVVALQGISGKSTGASAAPLVLDQKGCEYEPQISAIQTGQKVEVKNSDPTLHNVDVQPAEASGNKGENQAQLPGSPPLILGFNHPELFIKTKCDVHPWMFAWVSVFDHPYFSVTDKDGKYTIKNVPDGKYTIAVYHRKAAPAEKPVTAEVEVKGGSITKDFTLEAK